MPHDSLGPVTPETYELFDDYDCRPDTPDDKIDPVLAEQIAEDRRILGLDGNKNRSSRA